MGQDKAVNRELTDDELDQLVLSEYPYPIAVNYRRLLDDRHWPHTARLADIARRTPHHVPAPFAALRTLKGELIVDLQPGQAEALAAADPTWMINGERGVVQFVDPYGQ